MNLPFTNIRQILSLHNKVSPEKTFLTVITDNNREDLSYAEFSARTHQAANFLQEDLQIQPDDVVAIIDDRAGDSAVLMAACWLIGAVALPLPVSPSDVTATRLAASGAKVAFMRHTHLPDWRFYRRDDPPPEIRRAWDNLPLIIMGGDTQPAYQHFHTLVRSLPNTFFNDHPEPTLDSCAALLADRMHSQRDLLTSALHITTQQMISGNHHLIHTAPDQPAVAIDMLLATLLVGASLIATPVTDLDASAFWHEVAASRLHIASLSAAHIRTLIAYAQQQRQQGKPIYGSGVYQQDIKHFRHLYCPDVAGDDDLIKQFTTLFPFPIITSPT